MANTLTKNFGDENICIHISWSRLSVLAFLVLLQRDCDKIHRSQEIRCQTQKSRLLTWLILTPWESAVGTTAKFLCISSSLKLRPIYWDSSGYSLGYKPTENKTVPTTDLCYKIHRTFWNYSSHFSPPDMMKNKASNRIIPPSQHIESYHCAGDTAIYLTGIYFNINSQRQFV